MGTVGGLAWAFGIPALPFLPFHLLAQAYQPFLRAELRCHGPHPSCPAVYWPIMDIQQHMENPTSFFIQLR